MFWEFNFIQYSFLGVDIDYITNNCMRMGVSVGVRVSGWELSM